MITQVKNRSKVELHLNTKVFSPIRKALKPGILSGVFGTFALVLLPA